MGGHSWHAVGFVCQRMDDQMTEKFNADARQRKMMVNTSDMPQTALTTYAVLKVADLMPENKLKDFNIRKIVHLINRGIGEVEKRVLREGAMSDGFQSEITLTDEGTLEVHTTNFIKLLAWWPEVAKEAIQIGKSEDRGNAPRR